MQQEQVTGPARSRSSAAVGLALAAAALSAPLWGPTTAQAAEQGLVPLDPSTVTRPAIQNGTGDTPESVNFGNPTSKAGVVAAAAVAGCDANYACVWVDANYGGTRGRFAEANASWGAFSVASCSGGTWKNCASSAINSKAVDTFYVWTDVNYGGSVAGLGAGFKAASFSGTYDNNVESNFF